MKPDARVQFPQSHAPIDESLARAVVSLAESVAKGDADAFGKLLDTSGRATLDSLTSSGDWDLHTKKIEAVRIVSLSQTPQGEKEAATCMLTLAVQEPGAAYAMGFAADKANGAWTFKGAESPGGTRARATDWDGTASSATASAMPALPPGIDPAAAAAMAQAMGGVDEILIMGYAALDLVRRIETASGSTLNSAQKDQAMAAFGQLPPGALEELKTQARAKIDAGVQLSNEKIAMLVKSGDSIAAQLGNKVTHDQVVQFVSNILGIPDAKVRQAIGELPGTLPGTPKGPTGPTGGG